MQNQFSKRVTTRQPKTIDQYPSLQLSQTLRNGYWNNRWMVHSVDENNPISENQFEFIHRFSTTDALLNSITKKLIWTKACVHLETCAIWNVCTTWKRLHFLIFQNHKTYSEAFNT